jgi:hypothetical protein
MFCLRDFLDSRLRGNDEIWRIISLMSLIEFLRLPHMGESRNPGKQVTAKCNLLPLTGVKGDRMKCYVKNLSCQGRP